MFYERLVTSGAYSCTLPPCAWSVRALCTLYARCLLIKMGNNANLTKLCFSTEDIFLDQPTYKTEHILKPPMTKLLHESSAIKKLYIYKLVHCDI